MRRTQRDAAVVHHLEHFGGAAVAVLDRVDAGEDRAAHAFGGGRVRGGEPAGIVRDRDSGSHLGFGQGGAARLAGQLVVVGVHLDDVGAGGDLVAHRAGHLVGAADLLGALRNMDARLEALGP